MLKRERSAESNGKLPHLFIYGKTAALVPEFAVEDLLSAELEPSFLILHWKTMSMGRTNFGFLVCGGRHAFGRTISFVPALAVKDLPLGRTL